MSEKREITKQLIKNMFINFIIFTSILLIFDFIIYNQVSDFLDREMNNIPLEEFMQPHEKENRADIGENINDGKNEETNPKLVIRNKILHILVIGTIILVIISIALSYVLSKWAMRPMILAYKKQTEFVQNASHELRTPLTIIQGKQELLLTEPNKKIIEKSEDINLTLKETRRLTKLIKELMDLARAEDDREKLQKEKINIDKLIEELIAPYVDLANMQEKNLDIDLKYDKDIMIDKNRISEVLIILLDNAIKYTNKGDSITIKTYAKDGKCNIDVQDTGIGISDEGLKHVFERFYREDKARSRETGGNRTWSFYC